MIFFEEVYRALRSNKVVLFFQFPKQMFIILFFNIGFHPVSTHPRNSFLTSAV